MDSLSTIEQREAADTIKVRQLETLLALCRRCLPQKDSVYARIAHRLGSLYQQQGDWTTALHYTKEAVAVNSRGKGAQEAFLTNSYFNLGLFYQQLYLYAESQHYYDSCILIGVKYPAKTPIALMAFENRAFSLYRTGDYQKSIETADAGIAVARQQPNILSEIALLAQKAQSQAALNEVDAAAQTIRTAIQLLPPDATAERVTCLTIYAGILGSEKKFKAAIDYYRQALAVNRRLERWDQCALNLVDLGYLYNDEMKDAGNAIRCYQQGIQMAQKINDPYLIANICNNLGAVYWRLQQYRKALGYYQQGLNALPVHFTDTALQHNPDDQMLRGIANDYFVSTLLANKGESLLAMYKSSGDTMWLRYALHTFRTADKAIDLMRWKQYGEPSKLFWRNKTKKMYAQAIETCYLLQDPVAAFPFFEKSRAVLLNDKLNELGASKYLKPADISREQELRIQAVMQQQRTDAATPGTPAYEQQYTQLLGARDALERFIRDLEKNYPSYYQYKYDTGTCTVTDVRTKLLTRGQWLVEYFTADSAVYLLAVSARECTLLKTYADHKAVQELLQLCRLPSMYTHQYEKYNKLAFNIYQQLFKPLQLTPGPVIISPDDYLLPFEVLQSDSADASSLLVKKYAFSYTYSAGSLMKTQQERSGGDHTFLGIAPVNYAAYLQQPALPGGDRSLQRIKQYYPATLCLADGDATRQQFLHQLPGSRIVQLYAHASAGTPGKEPVMYLADSALYLSELQLVHDTVTSLIILSACEAGIGKQAGGEGVLSLARGFSLTGIPAVVTTLWQIDNEATYTLTENFHRLLSQGVPKDVALQQAKLQFLENNDKGNTLPYYWAASILLGDTTAIPPPASTHRPVTFLMIAGLLLLVTAWLLYRKLK